MISSIFAEGDSGHHIPDLGRCFQFVSTQRVCICMFKSAVFAYRGMQKERIWKCLVQEQNFDNEILYNLLLLWDKSILSSESVIEAYRRSLKELNISSDSVMSVGFSICD
ncbi:unnamed protein product [Gongylonema pulchrum]|uniref:Death domain-containing protein n=1 Tax=Gongylonema pulchrum TaxID=637853 RepID=A0A183E709_9BILA|nr:unnamed protein product [Gongylonema pulchrum]